MRRLLALLLVLTLAPLSLTAFAESEDDEAIDAISAFLQSALDAEGFSYSQEDVGYFALTYEAESGALGDIYAYLDTYSTGVLIYACYEKDVPPECVDEIARFINLVNGELRGMKYFILPESGTIFHELPFFLNSERLRDDDAAMVLKLLDSVVDDLDYDTDYFMEIVGGETAEHVFAMFLADYYHE